MIVEIVEDDIVRVSLPDGHIVDLSLDTAELLSVALRQTVRELKSIERRLTLLLEAIKTFPGTWEGREYDEGGPAILELTKGKVVITIPYPDDPEDPYEVSCENIHQVQFWPDDLAEVLTAAEIPTGLWRDFVRDEE